MRSQAELPSNAALYRVRHRACLAGIRFGASRFRVQFGIKLSAELLLLLDGVEFGDGCHASPRDATTKPPRSCDEPSRPQNSSQCSRVCLPTTVAQARCADVPRRLRAEVRRGALTHG